jgi:hypothetical protein
MTTNEFNPFEEKAWGENPEQASPASTSEDSVNSQNNESNAEPENSQNTGDEGQQASTNQSNSGQEPTGTSEATQSSGTQDSSIESESELEEGVKFDFKNEISQKIFEAVVSGNFAEVAPIIYEQTMLGSLDKIGDEDLIKLSIKYENPDMTEADILKEYQDRYGLDIEEKDTTYMSEDEIAEYNKSIEKAKKRMVKEVKRDAREAMKFLSEKKMDIELPNINEYIKNYSSKEDNSKEIEEYNSYLQTERQKYESTIDTALDSVKPFEMEYKDDEVNFKVNFMPNKDELMGMKDQLKSFTLEDYFGPRYYNQEKGDYNTNVLAEDLYWINNREKIVKSIVSQAVSSAKADMLKKIKGVSINDAPSSKSTNQSGKSELDSWVENLYSM